MPKYVVITTQERGVFAGEVAEDAVPGPVLQVENMRNCLYWTILDCTPEARAAWEAAPWQ